MSEEPGQNQAGASPVPGPPPVPSREFLEAEYSVANQWAMHAENLSHRIFSFYVTLVTATLGGALAIGQGLSQTFQSSLLIIGAGCFILMLAGPVFYEALVLDYMRNVAYRRRMDRIRQDLVLNYLSGQPQTPPGSLSDSIARTAPRPDPYHPSAIQHTLVGLINSILVALAIPSILWGVAGPGYRLLPTLIMSVLMLFLTFVLHRVARHILVRRHAGDA